jgi:hypothetical protein
MDDTADLITRAARYRALAAHVTDEPTRAGLIELAEKYEALARSTEAARRGRRIVRPSAPAANQV